MWYGFTSIAFRGDNGKGTFVSNVLPDLGATIGFIGDESQRWAFPIEKSMHQLAIMNMAATDSEPDRSAFLVYSRMNLTCATPA